MSKISPLASIDPKAQLASDVEVGPFCVIGPDVRIGRGCKLISSVTIMGHTTLGEENVMFPNVVLGAPPQDKKYKGAATRVEIGSGNMFREAATIHAGTEKGGGVTKLGDNNLVMVNAHIGHDASVGSHCILANNITFAGHVLVGDYVNVSAGTGVHHFVTIGDYCFIGAHSRIHYDVPPFLKVDGADEVRGLNSVGLRRAGFPEADIEALEAACRRLFYQRNRAFSQAMAEFDTQNGLNTQVKKMVEFLRRRDLGKHGRYLESLRPR